MLDLVLDFCCWWLFPAFIYIHVCPRWARRQSVFSPSPPSSHSSLPGISAAHYTSFFCWVGVFHSLLGEQQGAHVHDPSWWRRQFCLAHWCLKFLQSSVPHGGSSSSIEVALESRECAGGLVRKGKGRKIFLLCPVSCCFSFSFVLPFPSKAFRLLLKFAHLLPKSRNIVIGVSYLSASLPANAICCPVPLATERQGVRQADGERDMTWPKHHIWHSQWILSARYVSLSIWIFIIWQFRPSGFLGASCQAIKVSTGSHLSNKSWIMLKQFKTSSFWPSKAIVFLGM